MKSNSFDLQNPRLLNTKKRIDFMAVGGCGVFDVMYGLLIKAKRAIWISNNGIY
jgi:hypothetical protein